MTLGIPISLSMQSSNVIDPVKDIEELMMYCDPPIFSEGFELRDSDWIFEYNGVEFTPRIWNQPDADAGLYDMDEILVKNCTLIKVTGKDGSGILKHEKPCEPEEYGSYDYDMDAANWKHRYVRVANTIAGGWLDKMWRSPEGKRWYYMFWENRGYGGCGSGGWRWSAKDLSAIGERSHTWYLRSCLKNNYSNKFDMAKDIKATVPFWGSTGCGGICPKENTVQFQSMIERGGYFYFRTNVNVPLKYRSWETGVFSYTYMDVISPADIDGFIQKRRVNAQNPFDGRGYTKAEVDTTLTDYKATWTCLASEAFDSITFGKVICDSIDIVFKTEDGDIIEELNRFVIDNTVAKGTTKEYEVTRVLYASQLLPAETVIEITLNGSYVSIGSLLASDKMDAGFTKFSFNNEMKDFTPKEQDQWGNWVYLEDGMKLRRLNATVEFPIVDYDGLERMMMMLGGGNVVIDASDATENQVPDGRKVFSATQMIARIVSIKLQSQEKDKRIGEIGRYDIVIEEIV